MRQLAASLAVLALGLSVTALNAADRAPVPAEAPAAAPAEGPRFVPSADAFAEAFGDMDAPAAIAVPSHAVDVETLAPSADTLGAEIGAGVASWYGRAFAGRKTASGERFDPAELTAAHRTLPFGTKVRVTHAGSGRSVVVRINDRGPFHGSRVIDLSQAAAEAIGIRSAGSGRVTLATL